jgi:hypothetical protein
MSSFNLNAISSINQASTRSSNYWNEDNGDPTLKAYSTKRSITEQVNHAEVAKNTNTLNAFSDLDSLMSAFKTANGKFNLDDIISVMLLCYSAAGDNAQALTTKMRNMEAMSRALKLTADAYQDIMNYAKNQTLPAIINAAAINGNPTATPPTAGLTNLATALKSLGGWDGTDANLKKAWVAMNKNLTTDMSNIDNTLDTSAITNSSNTFVDATGSSTEIILPTAAVATAADIQGKVSDSSDAATSTNQKDTASLQGLNNNLQFDISMIANVLDKMNQLFSLIARVGG